MAKTSANHYHRLRLRGKILHPYALFSQMRRLTKGTQIINLPDSIKPKVTSTKVEVDHASRMARRALKEETERAAY
jgi:hypothetical protein